MATLIALVKGEDVSMGCNGLHVLDGLLSSNESADSGCVIRLGDSLVGFSASLAFQQAVVEELQRLDKKESINLPSPAAVRNLFQQLHENLKARGGFIPQFVQGADFEVTPMNALVANRSGVYRIDSQRGVYHYQHFWALGSGDCFALGAMHALYDKGLGARQIVDAALATCQDFDPGPKGRTIVQSLQRPRLARAVKEPKQPIELRTRARKKKDSDGSKS